MAAQEPFLVAWLSVPRALSLKNIKNLYKSKYLQIHYKENYSSLIAKKLRLKLGYTLD